MPAATTAQAFDHYRFNKTDHRPSSPLSKPQDTHNTNTPYPTSPFARLHLQDKQDPQHIAYMPSNSTVGTHAGSLEMLMNALAPQNKSMEVKDEGMYGEIFDPCADSLVLSSAEDSPVSDMPPPSTPDRQAQQFSRPPNFQGLPAGFDWPSNVTASFSSSFPSVLTNSDNFHISSSLPPMYRNADLVGPDPSTMRLSWSQSSGPLADHTSSSSQYSMPSPEMSPGMQFGTSSQLLESSFYPTVSQQMPMPLLNTNLASTNPLLPYFNQSTGAYQPVFNPSPATHAHNSNRWSTGNQPFMNSAPTAVPTSASAIAGRRRANTTTTHSRKRSILEDEIADTIYENDVLHDFSPMSISPMSASSLPGGLQSWRKRAKSIDMTHVSTSVPAVISEYPPPSPHSAISSISDAQDDGGVFGTSPLPPPDPAYADDPAAQPRRQKLRYAGDQYTPEWVRFNGSLKEGHCDMCPEGKWLQLKNSAFWYHKQFFHGISSVSGKPFMPPKRTRIGHHDTLEGHCHQCDAWIPISNAKNKKNTVLWYRHAHKCHVYAKPRMSERRRRER